MSYTWHIYKYIYQSMAGTPRGGYLFGMFRFEELEGRGPHEKKLLAWAAFLLYLRMEFFFEKLIVDIPRMRRNQITLALFLSFCSLFLREHPYLCLLPYLLKAGWKRVVLGSSGIQCCCILLCPFMSIKCIAGRILERLSTRVWMVG